MRTTSIRTHVMILVLAVSIPLLAVVGLAIYSDMQQTIVSTKTSLRILANTMVRNTGNKIASAREVLERISVRPLVVSRDPEHCDPIIQNLKFLNPGYANVGYSNINGQVVCSAVPSPTGKPINLGNTPWYKAVVKKQAFSISKPFLGPFTHKWVSVLSVPIWNNKHKMVGVLSLPLDHTAFDPSIPSHLLPEGSHYGFFSDDGILIWRNVDPQNVIGTRPTAKAALRIVEEREGEFESVASDGVSRFISAIPIPELGMIAWVAVPSDAIYAEAKKRAVTATITLVAVITFLFIVAILIARRITTPVLDLARVVREIQRGVHHVSATVQGPSEIAAVATEFNAMINAQQHSVEQLRIAATAFEAQESMMITDANSVILRVNNEFTKSTGYSFEEAVGQTPRILKSDRHDEQFYRDMWATLISTGTWKGEIWDRRKNGEVYPKWLSISAVKDANGKVTHYVGSHIDITDRKTAEEAINHLAYFDSLTNLPNRRLLMDRLQHALSSSTRRNCYGALLFLDLDNFKSLNDTLGHEVGDQLLQIVAQRLNLCVRRGDTVARLGGDEFVLILESLNKLAIEAATQVENIGEQIKNSLNQTYHLGVHEYNCTSSIGVTLFVNDETRIEELMKQADIAMYQAKKAGRNNVCFYDQQMQENISYRVLLEKELNKAITRQQLLLYYQVQVDRHLHPIGAEALVRWQHPTRGIVNPGEFIPLAEESGMILPLGHWVLASACQQLANWSNRPETSKLTISVNISAKQFHLPTFVDEVLTLVAHFGIDPSRLKLEITESMLLEKVDEIIIKMNLLKSHGINFSLDDFGTGYSSLQYLKKLPLDQLKIDQSFVRDIVSDTNDQAIVRTIIDMAKNMNVDIISEGVETEEQCQLLNSNGCKSFQGFLFGRPVPIDQFEKALRKS